MVARTYEVVSCPAGRAWRSAPMSDPAASFDVVVVGAGPAGLAAARRAAESGKRVAMVDDNPAPGGQIWRGEAHTVPGAKTICGARVVAAPAAGRLTLETFDGVIDLAYTSLVLATGARERFLPFPGWTLPH